jgi:ATP-dependent DNA helicase RecG
MTLPAPRVTPSPGPLTLQTPVKFLKGAGPKRGEALERLDIRTVGELLLHYPRDYVDRRTLQTIASAQVGELATLVAQVLRVEAPRRRGRQDTILTLEDDTGVLHAVWFGQPYMKRHFKKGDRVILSGMVGWFDRKRLTNPDWDVMTEDETRSLHFGRLVPIYPATLGLSQRVLRTLVRTALDAAAPLIDDVIPEEIRRREGLLSRREAISRIHFPETAEDLGPARATLVYEEALTVQMTLRRIKHERETRRPGIAFPLESPLARKIEAALPFELTADQRQVLAEIEADMALPRPMGRLLQGDVGSGKTVVALLAAVHAIDAGYQAAFMAPTETLADQHLATFERLAAPHGIPVVRLTGAVKGRDRRAILEAIRSGEARLVVGTHALIQDEVEFQNLGFVVVDEQHRFGVFQRADLKAKGVTPDLLAMTATPIPRTLYLTKMADLSLSTIRHRPAGRGAVLTRVTAEENRDKVYDVLARELSRGRQVYVVYPLVEESEKLDLKAATSMVEALRADRRFLPYAVGLLHGRMKSRDKAETMDEFRSGKIRLLVATTVIEVGIDVPNATVMLIEHPERFGLSQLHQLRGRIGRGSEKSYCILIESFGGGPAHERLKIFEATQDGFALAEADLRFRGAGSILGVRQHGLRFENSPNQLRIADPVRDQEVMERAHLEADRLARTDPRLQKPVWRPLRDLVEAGLDQNRKFLDAG